jgi:hypothetical protein
MLEERAPENVNAARAGGETAEETQ